VAGTSVGAASRFASTDTVDTDGSSRTSTGPQAACAASGTARANAAVPPVQGSSRAAIGAASSTSPAVAAADSAKPNERASQGSVTSSPTTDAASAGTDCDGRPNATPVRANAAITAARSTAGSGRTSATNARDAHATSTTRTGLGTRAREQSRVRTATTTAKWPPETAVMWLRPVVRISSARSSGSRVVSPIAAPGTRPRP
jgi:hypothetical protein